MSCRSLGRMAVLLFPIYATLAISSASWAANSPTINANDWPSYGGAYDEQHFSPLTRVDKDNVAKLGLAWSLELPNTHNGATVPLAVNGVIYFCVDQSIVRAVDATTGKLLWLYDPKVAVVAGRKLRNAWGVRGMTYSEGKVYVGTMDGRLIAIDAANGKPLWTQLTVGKSDSRYITGAPRVFDGLVIIGHAGAEYVGVRGYVTAYDTKTGAQRWRFYTIPGDPTKGFENDAMRAAAKTWSGKTWASGGGGAVWNAITIDPEQRLVFIGTSNGVPWNQGIRSPEGGDNLYLTSIVALDLDTGAYRWHYQTTPADTWDYDSSGDIELATLQIQGKARKVILHAPKNGFYYVIDRTNGKLISAEPFTKVTWAERIDLKTGRPVEAPGARYYKSGPKLIWPSSSGATNWQPASFNPLTSLSYFQVVDMPGYLDNGGMSENNWIRPNNQVSLGLQSSAADAPIDAATSRLIAWDPNTQTEKWRVATPGGWNGGVLSTAGQLVFQGRATGEFAAHDASTGKKLWSFDARMGITGAPISFSVNGEQYIAVVAGWGASGAGVYGSLAAQYGWISRVHSHRLLAFKLGGKAQLPSDLPAPMLTKPIVAPEFKLDAQRAKRGEDLYSRTCLLCHGSGAVAAGFAPDLRASSVPLTMAAFKTIVQGGGLLERGMPRYDELSDADLEDLRHFIRRQARDPNVGPKKLVILHEG
ncbi:MAG: PQQ-dependent dehydrogenase, methanol/ethanol family [Steroidobacteraceae bacterium]